MTLYDWGDYAEPMSAKDIVEGIERRHRARLAAGNVGEWQTEINEIYRALHEILNRLEPKPEKYDIESDDYY